MIMKRHNILKEKEKKSKEGGIVIIQMRFALAGFYYMLYILVY